LRKIEKIFFYKRITFEKIIKTSEKLIKTFEKLVILDKMLKSFEKL